MKTNNVNETLLILAKELIENVTEPITMDENLKNIGFNSLIFVKLVVSIAVLKGKLPRTQNKRSFLESHFLILDIGVVIHNPWPQIPSLFFFCG